MGAQAVLVHVDVEPPVFVDRAEKVVPLGDSVARELCKHGRLGPGPREALLDAGVEDEGGDDALFHHAALHAVHLDGIKVDGDGVEDVFRERVPAAVLVLSVEAEELGVG